MRPRHPRVAAFADLARWVTERSPQSSIVGVGDPAVSGVSLASDRVLPGDLYAALPGSRSHGASYVGRALEAGAVAVLTDPAGRARIPGDVPTIVVDQPRGLLGELSAEIYGHPARSLRLIGVTGTQGKTTTTRLAESALQRAGVVAATIGTVGTRIDGVDVKTALTTPEAPDLHGLFARMVEDGVEVCAMEVSSHALVLGRVDGVVFDLAVFTNLGRDHLDFHADLDDYFAAKASLFSPERATRGLVNVDDEFGRRLLEEATIALATFSTRDGVVADWTITDVATGPTGSTGVLRGPRAQRMSLAVPVTVPLPGAFNVANAVAALAACAEVGCDVEVLARALADGPGVPGRLELVAAGQDFTVVVDYAHKPDAVEAALHALRPLTEGSLIVVIGAGGERDPGKRLLMGEIAARLADLVIVADDNPRGEDPAQIRAAVLAGTEAGSAEVREIGDRREAIKAAIGAARPGDVVLIAGKGHEIGQQVGDQILPFDDRSVAAEEVAVLFR